jgi:hypothetical protein
MSSTIIPPKSRILVCLVVVSFMALLNSIQSSAHEATSISRELTQSEQPSRIEHPRVSWKENQTTSESNIIESTDLSYVNIDPNDYIYYKDQSMWDAAPIVIESHKLVFFTVPKVGCTVWKQLFRRMMGYKDWKHVSPHDPQTNGITYLWDYDITRATEIMNDPAYTKAIFVRDPKERLLSAYLEKAARGDSQALADICCPDRSCLKHAKTFQDFIRFSQTECKGNAHWLPQSQRMEQKFWDKIDFVGHMDTAALDAKRLLRRIGAWKQYGKKGWGSGKFIFESVSTVNHATSSSAEESRNRLEQYYTPVLDSVVERIYENDYRLKKLNLTAKRAAMANTI